jgi:hypothetical protein
MENGVSLGQGSIEHETDKAILVDLDDRTESLWIPKSQIHDDSEVFAGPGSAIKGNVVVTEWWAEKQGLV